jgi:hypothetical protein
MNEAGLSFQNDRSFCYSDFSVIVFRGWRKNPHAVLRPWFQLRSADRLTRSLLRKMLMFQLKRIGEFWFYDLFLGSISVLRNLNFIAGSAFVRKWIEWSMFEDEEIGFKNDPHFLTDIVEDKRFAVIVQVRKSAFRRM